MVYYEDLHIKIYNADCRKMEELGNECVHMVCTSPPYWGLRKYSGVPDLVFDGDDCQHEWVSSERWLHRGTTKLEMYQKHGRITNDKITDNFCLKCNAWRGQLGQEPTPESYIRHIVSIFREVRRVLRKDGCVFINIGDSYHGGHRKSNPMNMKQKGSELDYTPSRDFDHEFIKPQDKCLIPFRLAIALQEDGWWVRQDIIWQKNNPMPESVSSPRWVKHRVKIKQGGKIDNHWKEWRRDHPETIQINPERRSESRPLVAPNHPYRGDGWEEQVIEGRSKSEYRDCPGCEKCQPDGLVLRHGSWRPTESHEYILMLTKTNDYYCDGEAVREPLQPSAIERYKYDTGFNDKRLLARKDEFTDSRRLYGFPQKRGYKSKHLTDFGQEEQYHGQDINSYPSGRNLRSVWTFSTQNYAGAHYATFPEKLPELCIKAGTSEWGVCAECGKPWARILKQNTTDTRPGLNVGTGKSGGGNDPNQALHQSELSQFRQEINYQTLGWKATCNCRRYKLRDNLTDEEKEYVNQELTKYPSM